MYLCRSGGTTSLDRSLALISSTRMRIAYCSSSVWETLEPMIAVGMAGFAPTGFSSPHRERRFRGASVDVEKIPSMPAP